MSYQNRTICFWLFQILQYFVMSVDLCKCHCGTRITIDEQLLQERQAWRQKYLCLQKQAASDIGRLKQNIYAQCAALMQQEFTAKEAELNSIVNQKNAEIQSLTTRVINLESKIKILEKESQILRNKEKELELYINDKEGELKLLRSRGVKTERDWEVKLEEELAIVRKKITQQYQQQLQKIEAQNEHLKHKVKQFEKKYQIIIPEVQKLKNSLNSKNQQIQHLQSKLDKIKKESQQQLLRTKQENDQLQNLHSKCKGTINKLSDKVQSLTQELQNSRKVKKQVKIEAVYIDRPVEVQKIIQKIVEVEKIVNKYIEPTNFPDKELQAQNIRLKEQIARLLKEIQQFEARHKQIVTDYQECISQHEENVLKYKRERQNLAKRIEQQQKQLDTIHTFLEKRKLEQKHSQPQKIVVHVNRDGTYQKTIERMSSNSGVNVQSNKASKKR